MVKKLISAIVALVFSLASFEVSAQEIFYSEFKNENSLDNISINTTGGKAFVLKTSEDAYLEMADTDKDSNSGVVLVKKISSEERCIAFETKFKCSAQIPVTEFAINAASGKCFYARIYSTGMITVSDGSREIATVETKIVTDKWYTLRMVADKYTKKGELKIISNELKGYKGKYNKDGKLKQLDGEYTICELDFSDTYKEGCFESINISTTSETGSIYIAYLKIEDGNNLTMKEPPKPTPIVDDPVPHPVKNQINIKYNDEYMYFAVKPIIISNRVMLPVRNVYEMIGMNVEWNNEELTVFAKKDGLEISLKAGSKQAVINGDISEMDVAPLIKNNRIFVPVRFVCESSGLDVSWDSDTKTVIMREKQQ